MSSVRIYLVPYYFSCSEESRPYCLNYTNTSGELAVTRFTYNRKGLNERGFYQQITGSRSSVNEHTFDKAGRMVRKYRKYSDNETSDEVFTYDSKGRLVEESFVSSRGPRGTATYEYDDAGNAVRMLCNGYKGWLECSMEFDFDQHGKRLAGRLFKDGASAGKIEYDYDRAGNLIHEHWDLGDGGWSQTLRYVYESADSA